MLIRKQSSDINSKEWEKDLIIIDYAINITIPLTSSLHSANNTIQRFQPHELLRLHSFSFGSSLHLSQLKKLIGYHL